MNILEIIEKKRVKEELTKEEIDFAFSNYIKGNIEDYQMASLLMAITINGMTFEEIITLTDVILHSGKILDLSKIDGVKVDKHSTGGVGDKTSMIIGPIMASLGLKMGKLSGRGLGFTGGTIDKLESIPGFRVALTSDEFLYDLDKVGFVECEQTPEFTPLDKKIYNLRSVTGTVSSIPLIASSVMAKKLATGAEYILIDIKVGEGALMKEKKHAIELAKTLIEIGKRYKREVIPVLTDMNVPLGDNIGNALEVKEAMDILKGKKGTLRDLSIELSSTLLSKSMHIDLDEARAKVTAVLDDGRAYNKFLEFVENQGGDIENLTVSESVKPVFSPSDGVIENISALEIGELVVELGGGRLKKGDKIDYGVGVIMKKHIGDEVKTGDVLCELYVRDEEEHSNRALKAFSIVKKI